MVHVGFHYLYHFGIQGICEVSPPLDVPTGILVRTAADDATITDSDWFDLNPAPTRAWMLLFATPAHWREVVRLS
jgi:hypothetical protein